MIVQSRSHFICWFRLDNCDRYLLWYSGEPDGVFVDETGAVPAFRTPALLAAFAKSRGISLVPEHPRLHDLDAVARWSQRPTPARVYCRASYSAWNLFADVS